ncbi:hypothetical protein KMZ93_06020 [Bradyrhizobium sediminis]|uniref:Uncharacterized protein n=1 Tax=Bradyrhizobium sediminis TaxID=2840469 RepID=A0A975P127_9BRAD|nr:hypothetical protein [Bradyrhizobium sediminis]QWG24461.1 hypothetical protein KMZ93_06020 [Bradyrhizobium sediminis]
MCQQWLSAIGLIADVIGFLMIAWEWRQMFLHDRSNRELAISEIRARYFARLEGRDRTEYEMDEGNYHLPKHMENALNYQFDRRRRFFYGGAALVILGFLGQVAGSLPGGIPGTPFQSCSTFGWAPTSAK